MLARYEFSSIQTLLYSPYGYTRVVEIRKMKGYPDIAGGDLKETLKNLTSMECDSVASIGSWTRAEFQQLVPGDGGQTWRRQET